MKVLVACEESQAVCKAFRARGHEAYSCDIIECSGGHPEWHIQGDVLKILNPIKHPVIDDRTTIKGIEFKTCDGKNHFVYDRWDMILAFPPCTHLCNAGQRWFVEGKKPMKLQREAISFFYKFVMADCEKIVIENPMGIMQTCYRSADQIINPYNFGEPYAKKTCLGLKGVSPLKVEFTEKPENCKSYAWNTTDDSGRYLGWSTPEIKKQRSKTFPGIARAMAEQWG